MLKRWWCCCKGASADDADGNAWSYLMQYVFLLIFHGCNVEMEMILRVWAKKMLLGEILEDLFRFKFLISFFLIQRLQKIFYSKIILSRLINLSYAEYTKKENKIKNWYITKLLIYHWNMQSILFYEHVSDLFESRLQ